MLFQSFLLFASLVALVPVYENFHANIERYFHLPNFAKAAKEEVIIKEDNFYDKKRDRTIPYLLYRPQILEGSYPLVIFSHGLGGSRYAASYLGEHLAQRGYICFHIQHPGSDESVWKGATSKEEIMRRLQASIKVRKNALNRLKDVPFVVDKLIQLNKQDPALKDHLDVAHIGMAGHSYGGRSTLFAAGERIGKLKLSFKEPRIKAGIILSPNIPNQQADLTKIYQKVAIPLLHITGTDDKIPFPIGNTISPTQRQLPYQHIANSDQYLLVLADATHTTFSGRMPEDLQDAAYEHHIRAVQKASTLFFDSYLKENDSACLKLQKDFTNGLSKDDFFTYKVAPK